MALPAIRIKPNDSIETLVPERGLGAKYSERELAGKLGCDGGASMCLVEGGFVLLWDKDAYDKKREFNGRATEIANKAKIDRAIYGDAILIESNGFTTRQEDKEYYAPKPFVPIEWN